MDRWAILFQGGQLFLFTKDLDHLVHNCTIFLCSLDVRNIVQGGDPLYAVFFLHRALEAILDQNECVFLQKTTV